MAKTRHKAGVTLIEMLVVVGVIALLAGFVVSLTFRLDNQGKERQLAAVFALLKTALIQYHEETNTFPSPDPGLDEGEFDEVVERGELVYEKLNALPASRQILKRIDGSFVKGDVSINDPWNVFDPWGTALDYRYDPNVGNFPELVSAGPDALFDTADDISSKRK